jgi:hypothetical protein
MYFTPAGWDVADRADLNHQAGQGQDELLCVWRYHAVFTDSPFVMPQAGQVFADWASGPLEHLPSGSFPANAAWLTLAAISHNLLRAASALDSLAYAKAQTRSPHPMAHAATRPTATPAPIQNPDKPQNQ